MQITLDSTILEVLLGQAAQASHLVGHLDVHDADAIVGPHADSVGSSASLTFAIHGLPRGESVTREGVHVLGVAGVSP